MGFQDSIKGLWDCHELEKHDTPVVSMKQSSLHFFHEHFTTPPASYWKL